MKPINHAKWKKDLDENGYARIKSVFTTEETDRIRAEALMCLNRVEPNSPALQVRKYNDQTWPALLFWPRDYSPYLNKIRKDERLASIAREALGSEIVQLNNQVYYRLQGDGDQFAWHQDISFREPKEHYSQIEESYLQTIIAVDPILKNGCIEFVPGSHKWEDKGFVPRDGSEKGLREFVRGDLEGEEVYANSGDVLVWSVMVVHGSQKNRSNMARMTYMNGFAKASSVSPKAGFPTYMKNGKVI